MKKEIVFVLAALITAAAGAVTTLQISVNGDLNPADLEYSLSPGMQTLTLGIWVLTDEPFLGDEGYFALLVLNSQGTITGGYTMNPPWPPLEIWPSGPEEMNGVYGTTMPVEPIVIPFSSGTVLHDGILFYCLNSAEDAVIRLYDLNEDFTLGTLMDQVVIDQTEPDTVSTPTLAKTTAAPAIVSRVNGGREETFVASATSSLGHALEYKFNWGDGNIGPWGAATQTHVYTYLAAATYNATVQARCMVDGTTSETSVPLVLLTEPVKSTAFFYNRWATEGRINCWAYRRNCRGDTNNASTGIGSNRIWVNSGDLALFVSTYNKTQPFLGVIPNAMCADLDRLCWGLGLNRICIDARDLAILAQYFNKTESFVPVCDTYYHYWTN